MVISNDKMKWLLKGYFVFVLLELFLLGSGQIIKYHSLTLRMANFILLNIFCFILFRKEKIKHEYLIMLYIYMALLVFSSIIGFVNGATFEAVFYDVKPLLFFIYLIPFSFLIKTEPDIERVIRIIKISAIILAILYFVYLLIYLVYPIIRFSFLPLEINGEVFFRGTGPFIFYKGFFFMMISVFLINKQTKTDKFILILLLVAVFLTLTRGFYLALVTPFIIMGLINLISSMKIKLQNLILLILFFVLLAAFLPTILNFIGDKSASDSVRMETVNKVNEAITPLSLVIGHGFGVVAGVNRVHFEVSYSEILHKQGIIGLVLWMLPLIYCFKKLIKDKASVLDKRFFLAVLSVYIISLTNPFINNPLGLSIIVISIISMDILYQRDKIDQGII